MSILPASGVRFALDDRRAEAPVDATTAQGGALAQQVDFPDFVAGLVHGVFEASVTTSIDQMNAYADLMQSPPVSSTHLDRLLNPRRHDD